MKLQFYQVSVIFATTIYLPLCNLFIFYTLLQYQKAHETDQHMIQKNVALFLITNQPGATVWDEFCEEKKKKDHDAFKRKCVEWLDNLGHGSNIHFGRMHKISAAKYLLPNQICALLYILWWSIQDQASYISFLNWLKTDNKPEWMQKDDSFDPVRPNWLAMYIINPIEYILNDVICDTYKTKFMAMFNGPNYERISARLIDALRHNLVRNFINILQKFGSDPAIPEAEKFNKQHRYGIVYEMNHIRNEIGEAPRLLEVIFHHLPHVLSFVMSYNFTKVFEKCPRVFQANKWDLVTYKKQQQMEIQEEVSHHFELRIPVDRDNSAVSIEKYIEGVITGVYAFPIWRKNSIIITPSVSKTPMPKKKQKKKKKDDGEIDEKKCRS